MFSATDLSALWLTLKLAGISTAILVVLGTPLALWLTHSRHRAKPLIEATISLPLILPPTVLGFYLLIALGPQGIIGGPLAYLGLDTLSFTFTGLVIGSVIYSLPFVVQPLQNTFARLDQRQLDVAATLGAGPWARFTSITLPQAKAGYITASILGFAHTLGEFGVVLMIGGNIPGETRVLSIAIYEHVETLRYTQAHSLSAGLLVFSFLILLLVYSRQRGSGMFQK